MGHRGFHLNVSYLLRRRHNRCCYATIKTPKSHLPLRSVCTRHNRKPIDGLHAWPLAPDDLLLRYAETELRPALEQRLQCAPPLDPCELMAEAEMNAGSKRDVPVRLAIEVELLGMRIGGRIHVG